MQRIQRYLSILLLFVAASGTARTQERRKEPAPVRVALVSSEKGDELVKVLTLAEAKLTDLPGVEVLERSAIDRVLREHKLALSGLVAADQAVEAGKLLSVDLFAVIDAGAEKKEVGGLVVFDARTGARLWDAALPSGPLDVSVRGVADGVKAAREKLGRLDRLRPVCLLTVRNVDLPRDQDAFCDSVGLLLERRLIASPDLAVLERRRLNQVNRERDLPTGSPLRQLLASVVTVELEVGRGPAGEGVRATALLSDNQGKSLGKAVAVVGKRDASALAAAVLEKTAEALKAKVAPGEPERKREAERFHREAQFYWDHKDPLRALPAAESALALSPDDPSLRAAVALGLLSAANEVLDPGGRRGVGSFVFKADPKTLLPALELARAGSERLVEVESLPEGTRLSPAGEVHQMFAGGELYSFLVRIGGLTEGVPDSARPVMDAVRANQKRMFEIRFRRASAAVADHASFDRYTKALSGSLFPLLTPAASAGRWVAGLEELRPWAAVARKHENARATASRELLAWAMFSFRYPRSPSEAERARLRSLWAELAEHPNRTIAAYGRLGLLATELKFGKFSEQQRRDKVRAFRLSVQDLLEKIGPEHRAVRLNLYLAASDGIDLLMNHPGHGDEMKELSEFMLAHKELAPSVVQMTAFYSVTRRKREEYRYAADLLRRALRIVDGKEGRFLTFAETPYVLRHDIDRYRLEYRNRLNDIAQADPEAAADLFVSLPAAENLIDVYPSREGILWLNQPVVEGGAVYVAAIQMTGSPPRYDVMMLRLKPGEGGRWESRKVPVSLGYKPWTEGPGEQLRLGISFGTSACVHQGVYYLGTQKHGIYVFPTDGGPAERITTEDGLPSDCVQGIACLGDRLYAYLGEANKDAYVVAWDLRQRRCEVLASSRRKEKRSPFDDSPPLVTSFFRPDAKRGRVLFAAFSPFTQQPNNGLWALDPKTGTFKKLFVLHHSDIGLFGPGVRVEGDRLVLPSRLGVFEYDLAKNDGHLTYDSKRLEVGPTRRAVWQVSQKAEYRTWTDNTWSASGTFTVAGGRLWAAKPFSRRPLDGGPPELLTPLRRNQKYFQPTESLQRFDDRRLLVGDSFGLWLVPTGDAGGRRGPAADRAVTPLARLALLGLLGTGLTAAPVEGVEVEPVERWSNFFAARDVAVNFMVNSGGRFEGRAVWRVAVEGATLARREAAVTAAPGRPGKLAVRFTAPPVRGDVVLRATLDVQVLDAGGKVQATTRRVLWFFPEDPFAGRSQWLKDLRITLFDPAHTTAEVFKKAGIPFEESNNLSALAELREGLVIVGEGASFKEEAALAGILTKLAARGVPVLCLAPADGTLTLPGGLAPKGGPLDGLSLGRQGVIRRLDKRLDADAWPADGKVVASSLTLGVEDGALTAEVAAGEGGWPWLEAEHSGGGRLVVCGFGVVKHWPDGPAPRFLFAALLKRLESEPPKDAGR